MFDSNFNRPGLAFALTLVAMAGASAHAHAQIPGCAAPAAKASGKYGCCRCA